MRLDATIADARRATQPYRQLRRAIGDVQLVGGLFVILGLVPMLLVIWSAARGGTRGARIMAIVNTLVLLGPGVWYFAAGMMMRRMNRHALRQSIWVARVQIVLVPATLLIGIFATPMGYEPHLFLIPAALTIFFVPALIALLFTFRRIGPLMDDIEPAERGFEALPVQVLAVEGAKPQAAAAAAAAAQAQARARARASPDG